MSNDSNSKTRPRLKYVRGCPFPDVPFFQEKNVASAMDYVPLDDDIIVCSYPKTGTTWMQYIVWQILYKGSSFPGFDDLTYRLAPFMEMSGIEAVAALPHPRFYKHHLPYDLMKTNQKAKFIYVYRHPGDTLTSFYHFNNSILGTTYDFDMYFEDFMNGHVGYGDYFDHFLSYYAHRDDDNLLLVAYEDLHKDKRGQILRIAKFLGKDYHDALIEDESLISKILEVTSFAYMKKNLSIKVPGQEDDDKKVNFFRKGVTGDGKSTMSKEQRDRLQQRIAEKLRGTEFVELWS